MRYRLSVPSARGIAGIVLAVWLAAAPWSASADSNARPAGWAKPVVSTALQNCYQLDEALYRSAQPDRKGFEEARKKGIRTIINLRSEHSDAKLVEGLGLNLIEIPLNAGLFSDDQILSALRAIQTSPKPVLIHCQHGSDRAGVVSAAYRVVLQGWAKDEAVAELKKGGFGFHRWYLNIPAFIKGLDVAGFRGRLAAQVPASSPQQAQGPGGLK